MRRNLGIIGVIFVALLIVAVNRPVYAQQTGEMQGTGLQDSVRTPAFEAAFRLPYSGTYRSGAYLKPLPRLYYLSLSKEQLVLEQLENLGFISRYLIDNTPAALPARYSFTEFAEQSRRESVYSNWRRIILESDQVESRQRGLLDFSFDLPAGDESAFSTIFGRPTVNLRINAMADMNIGASIQHTSDPSLPADQQTRVDPLFDQNLQLNIQGTVGDKLTIQTDWDTERIFDYQNRINIVYEGYEDEIFKRLEMGNVTMQTGNSLIRGSGSLFGLKSVAELGAIRITSVLSQQKGEGSVETITGGSQEHQISLRPSEYDNNRHFFLGFYTRQEFEESMSNPQQGVQILQLSDLNVWVLRENIQVDEGARLAVGLVDYGVVENSAGGYAPPDNTEDRFEESLIDGLRDPAVAVTASQLGLEDARDYEEGYFTPLREGQDYTVNSVSGYLSLNRALSSRDVLAVSYSYVDQNGETVYVGDINQGGNERIFLKMLRPSSISTDHKAFPLTMRNVYSLGVNNLTRENIELEVLFTEGNVSQTHLPGRTTPLIQDLGLDRVDSQGALLPDNQIDFGTGTLNAPEGRVVFPYLEPFGARMEELLFESGAGAEEIERLVFDQLYSERQQNAERASQNSFYRIGGVARGGTQDNFSLGIALVEGSVRVYANGTALIEGIDYIVDYVIGQITILNPRYTAQGQEIRIEYENQALASIDQKTFTGIRAEYFVNNDINLGSTFFRYSEQPLDDKIRLGDEPISNTVIGFDANARFDAPFITRLLDAFPLLSTSEASEIRFSGEFAQLRPGVVHTSAMERAIRNNDLFPDEVNGLSYIDDFEGSSIKISLMNVNRWHLAAAPAAVPGYGPDALYFEEDVPPPPASPLDMQADRADLRSMFSWYTIPRNISNILEDVTFTPESDPVEVTEVFPGRETRNPQEEFINTLDVYYDPQRRGQYNYNSDLQRLLQDEPERMWGGMTTVIPSGLEDFSQNNIEFLEFWVQPLLPGGVNPTAGDLQAYNGTIYIDVGIVSEDVVPNARLNTEDGLGLNPEFLIPDRPGRTRSWIPANPSPPEGEFSAINREIEDVGIDGISTSGNGIVPGEAEVFATFIESMRQQFGDGTTAFLNILDDPSNDDYAWYGEASVDHLPLHRRFHRLMGYHEGNTPLDQSDKKAVTNRPNTEGLLNTSRVELNNAYYQYEVPLNPADPNIITGDSGSGFVVDQVTASSPSDRWYLVRIPLQEFQRRVGEINDFQNITYLRMWMSGYEKPFTMRFATMDFVGSQWQVAEEINETAGPNAEISVAAINIEENSNRLPVPYRQPRGAIRAQNRSTQLQSLANEQSLELSVENLSGGSVQMVTRNFPGGLNLLNHSNLRMFVHGEGYENREDAELVLRLGNDLENNYYEYRQPVTPSDVNYPFMNYDPGERARLEEESREVWKYDENSMNIVLRAFNQLKLLRNQEAAQDPSQIYERGDLLSDAAPGAVIAIKGNPSLDRVSEMGMGIRNPFDSSNPAGPGSPTLSARFWLNELRVSGFDNEMGWAANARTVVQLADFATVNANMTRQTDGFGALDSRLGQRLVSDQLAYDVSSTLGLHRLIPERFGWNIPLTISTRRSVSTPRYLPNEGDIRLSDFEEAVRRRPDLNEQQQDNLISDRIRDVQTYSNIFSFNLSNLSKENSESRLARITLDNTTFNYVYNTSDARNPQDMLRDNWNFNSTLRYNVNFQQPDYLRPLEFLEDVPIFGLASGLRLGYMPSSITMSISTSRLFEERKRRIFRAGEEEQPLQQTHNFNYNTLFGFGYNLTNSITTSFQSRGIFDMNRISTRGSGLGGVDSTAVEPIPTFNVLSDVVSGKADPRRSSYQEDYTAGWDPNFDQIRALDWMTYTIRYGGGFRWENSPLGSNLGARVSNSLRLDHTLGLDLNDLLSRTFRGAWQQADREGAERRISQAGNETEASVESPENPLLYYGRKLLLKITSIQNLDISYLNSKSGSQAGYSGGSGLSDMIGGTDTHSPSLPYRLGINERIGTTRLIENINGTSTIQLPINNTYTDNLNVRTRFLPFENLSIELNWLSQWDERASESLSLNTQNMLTSVNSGSGNVSSSVWAFGNGYRDLFERQVQTAFDDLGPGDDVISDETGNGDRRTVLNRVTLQEDFRKAYLGSGTGAIGSRNFTPLPRPGWRLNLTGLEAWIPWLGNYMQRATITHAYEGRYTLGWLFNNNTDLLPSRRVGAYSVIDSRPEFEPTVINLEKRFAPLLQMNITWDSSLYTELGYSYSRRTSFALSNINITERTQKEIMLTLEYTVQNFRVPFFRNLRNNLDLSFTGRFIEDSEQRFLLDSDIDRALSEDQGALERDLSNFSISPRPPSGQTRINASAIVGYRFSNMIQANFEYGFSRLLPKSSRTFERTTHDIRFNIRLNLQSG